MAQKRQRRRASAAYRGGIDDLTLDAIGILEHEERVYRLLLGQPALAAGEIAQALGAARRSVDESLAVLERRGLVTRSTGRPVRYSPTSPAAALGIMLLERQKHLEELSAEIAGLEESYRAHRPALPRAAEAVEVISGRDAIVQGFIQLQRGATREMLVFDRPPYALRMGDNEPLELELLARGVRCRVVYDRAAIEYPQRMEFVEKTMASGEKARIAEALPMKLAIADGRLGLVPMALEDPGLEAALLVHASPLLQALVMLFELFWERGVPFSSTRRPQPPDDRQSADHERIVRLLLAGMKDEAIARQMGVTLRTAQRRVRQLMDDLGSMTRFQAGWMACRRALGVSPDEG